MLRCQWNISSDKPHTICFCLFIRNKPCFFNHTAYLLGKCRICCHCLILFLSLIGGGKFRFICIFDRNRQFIFQKILLHIIRNITDLHGKIFCIYHFPYIVFRRWNVIFGKCCHQTLCITCITGKCCQLIQWKIITAVKTCDHSTGFCHFRLDVIHDRNSITCFDPARIYAVLYKCLIIFRRHGICHDCHIIF